MRLHRYVRIEMIQCPIRLFTSIPSALIHPLDFFISSSWSLMLLSTGDGNEAVHLRRVSTHLNHGKMDHSYLSRSRAGGSRWRALNSAWVLSERTRHTVLWWISCPLLVRRAWWHVARVLRWSISLMHTLILSVGRVGRIGRTSLGNGRIYWNIRVRRRRDLACMGGLLVLSRALWQGH